MKSPLGLLLLFISYVSSSNNIPSLSSAFDYIIQNFSCFYVSSYLFNYTEGTMRMNQNRFLFPLTENMTKIEDSLFKFNNEKRAGTSLPFQFFKCLFLKSFLTQIIIHQ